MAKQSAFGTPQVTPANYRLVEITGDSLAAANNMLAAEGEIGAGRDITDVVPGGFSSAGAVNGNLRARSAAVFLDGVMGTTADVPANSGGTPPTADTTLYTPADALSYYTIEKRVGTTLRSANELLTIQYTDCVVNTLNIAANSGALSTYSAGLMAAGESYISAPLVDDSAAYNSSTAQWGLDPATNDLLVFHGGRIMVGDTGGSLVENDQFQSLEVVINNNVQGDEWTIRPSRFLHSFTEGIRSVELNMTLVFNDYHMYEQYTYGASGDTIPGYSLYRGQMDFTLANWQLQTGHNFDQATGNGVPSVNPQAIHFYLPSVVYAGFPVTLQTGRIVVTTNGRAVKPLGSTTPIIAASVRPGTAAF